VEIDPRFTSTQTDAFVDALKLFRIGYSWAGPVSLVVPYDPKTIRDNSPYRGTLVRFCIGLEAVEDLIADVNEALAVLAA
jgi:cysteine-S-conjugate beta-lyase